MFIFVFIFELIALALGSLLGIVGKVHASKVGHALGVVISVAAILCMVYTGYQALTFQSRMHQYMQRMQTQTPTMQVQKQK